MEEGIPRSISFTLFFFFSLFSSSLPYPKQGCVSDLAVFPSLCSIFSPIPLEQGYQTGGSRARWVTPTPALQRQKKKKSRDTSRDLIEFDTHVKLSSSRESAKEDSNSNSRESAKITILTNSHKYLGNDTRSWAGLIIQ